MPILPDHKPLAQRAFEQIAKEESEETAGRIAKRLQQFVDLLEGSSGVVEVSTKVDSKWEID